MPHLQWLGWQLCLWWYWWVSVGFTYRSVVKHPSLSTINVVSRNATDFVDHSAMNLIEGWNWLIFSRNSNNCSGTLIHFHGYIDDTFAIWPYGEEQLLEFLEKINLFHPSIKFTAKWSAKSVVFLDTTVTVDNEGCLITDLYKKPTDTHQYLHRHSCHSPL